ncbi:receptor-like protein kinase HSL1 [Cryptomeria japonica]|uniref:receptor-like protein kinase HSL1 n=1 Tax=Cryptomeria japonica TaxID=3369 RepID=UPI0027DA4558|nr:receptor-like protein kinase HSL1 [Cryptomeria japonica]
MKTFSFAQAYSSNNAPLPLAFFPCIITFSLLLPPCASLSQDGLILLKIKKADWGETNILSGWNESHQTPCGWSGISCDTFNTDTKIDLTVPFLSSNLTFAICSLPNLTTLILSLNEFSGSFPHGLLRCRRLRKLDLSSNHGSFPDGLLRCKRLRKLDLSRNEFARRLPSRISELSELRKLYLDYNDFSGSIPPTFGMLSKPEALFLDHNRLNGTFEVPGNLKSLVSFDIGNNALQPGVVTRELRNSRQLRNIGLENCKIVGRIIYGVVFLRQFDAAGLVGYVAQSSTG